MYIPFRGFEARFESLKYASNVKHDTQCQLSMLFFRHAVRGCSIESARAIGPWGGGGGLYGGGPALLVGQALFAEILRLS